MYSETDMTEEHTLNMEKQRKLNRQISVVLRAGVASAFVIILTGLILIPVLHSGSPMAVMTLSALPAGLAGLNPLALITAGILVVLILPVAVIIIASVYYVNIRDRRMIILCGILLAMLIFSFIYALI
jgi:uncharacterized membrane protein